MKKIKVSIVGASGYAGGELLRILLRHPGVEVAQVTSETYQGQFIKTVLPNLRGYPLKFSSINDLKKCDVLFLSLPHGIGLQKIEHFKKLAGTIIDLSGDFRLNKKEDYDKWYGFSHTNPGMLTKKILGLPEIYRDEIKKADLIACPGCMSTASILGLYPLIKSGLIDIKKPIIIEAKTGSSGSGNKVNKANLHSERSGVIRSFKPTGHRHSAEIIQELAINGNNLEIHFSATAIEAVRGILATAQVFLKKGVEEVDVWQAYREFTIDNPFIRIVKETKGNYRYPEPKLLTGTNMCEIGFEKDPDSQRLVIMSAIDNLVKGAAGQAVQCLNIKEGWEEDLGLEKVGLYPI
jgi:LysW-gamma-L-alpha-aminoadipyl-6-phosphate/LysW-L-glutamyl-5-phosphate reductase